MTKPHCSSCKSIEKPSVHPSYQDQIGRLNRINGQIEGIKKMIGDQRYCLDIMTQISAVRSALRAVEGHILEKHLHSCVIQALTEEEKNEKIQEIMKLFERDKR